jgi:hypothetical protein
MPISLYKGWAPSGRIWGPWIDLGEAAFYAGMFYYEVAFESESEAESTFDVQIRYHIGNEEKIDSIVGPGSHSFGFGMCGCKVRVRMRSHTIGQNVRITAKHP